jgi:hypothetical protein
MLGRPVLAILAVSVLLLAGCLGAGNVTTASVKAPAPPADLPRPEVAVPKFLPPVQLGVVTLGSEPGVAVAPDGTVYVVSPSVGAWRSDDQGKTYKALGKAACAFGVPACPLTTENDANGLDGGGDASFAVGPDGTVYSAGLSGKSGSIPFQLSTDKGQTWSKGFDVARKNSSDREWIVVNRTGSVFVSWRDFGSSKDRKCDLPVAPLGISCTGPPSAVMMARSDDGGTNWTMPIRVSRDGHEGPIAPDPSSAWIFLPHVENGSVVVSRSMDGGASWTTAKVGPAPQDTFDFPITTVDAAGTAYVVWNYDPNAPPVGLPLFGPRPLVVPQVFLSTSKDHGVTWSKPALISPAGKPALFPWAVAGDAGRLAVAWYEGTAPTPSDRTPNVWHAAVAMSTSADAEKPAFKESFVSEQPNHVGPICTEGSFCTLTGADRSLLDFFEIRLLPDGSPVLAFVGDNDVHQATVKIYATRMTDGTKLLGGSS